MPTQSHILKRYRYSILTGAVAGLLVSLLATNNFLPPVMALPGRIAAFLFSLIFHATKALNTPATIALYITNATAYSALTAFFHHLYLKSEHPEPKQSPITECCICGHRCVAPQSPTCPACGTASLFNHATANPQTPVPCQQCGYDLTGNITGQCPECGLPI